MIYRSPQTSVPTMAASSCAPDDFSCPVCLEILCDPATLACGHTYCLQCIQKHWDKASAKGQYSCPQCRQVFKPRPSLGRNNMLMEAMKKLRVGEQDKSSPLCSSLTPCAVVSVNPSLQPVAGMSDGATVPDVKTSVQGGLYPQLPSTSIKLCPLHKQVLEFFCCDDKESVCDECSLVQHKGHRVVHPDEEKEVNAYVLWCSSFYLFSMFNFLMKSDLFKLHYLKIAFLSILINSGSSLCIDL